jgi:sugar diacid utilization regulator
MMISNDLVTLNANDSKMVHNAEKLRLDLNSPRSVDVFLKKKLKIGPELTEL